MLVFIGISQTRTRLIQTNQKIMPAGINLSNCTMATSRYNFENLNIETLNPMVRQFVERIIKNKQVAFDWGCHRFYAGETPFSFDTERGCFTTNSKWEWLICRPDDLDTALQSIFEGEWSPTSVDTILRMENSGIEVTLCGSAEYLPDNPRKYMENLRLNLRPQTATQN